MLDLGLQRKSLPSAKDISVFPEPKKDALHTGTSEQCNTLTTSILTKGTRRMGSGKDSSYQGIPGNVHEAMLSPHQHYHALFPGQSWMWTLITPFHDMDFERLKAKGMSLQNIKTNTQAWDATSQ